VNGCKAAMVCQAGKAEGRG